MTNKECYRIWAPIGKKWTDWVRPVPFIAAEKNVKGYTIVFFKKGKEKYAFSALISDLLGQHFASTGPPGDLDACSCLRTTALVATVYNAS